jgi:hypothetical protein
MIIGERAGADPRCFAGDTPFGHDKFDLRTAWLDGFAKGRMRSRVRSSKRLGEAW